MSIYDEKLSKEDNFGEALRYYKSAKIILNKAKIEDGCWYTNRKLVQEATGVAYLAGKYSVVMGE